MGGGVEVVWPVYVGEFGGDLFVEVGPMGETEGIMDVVVELLSTSPLPPLLLPLPLPI